MNTPAASAVATFHFVQSFSSLNVWNSFPIVIILLMLQDIHPNIIHELLLHFQMKHCQVRDIILAMMQLRLFSSSFLLDIGGVRKCSLRQKYRMIRQNPQHRVSRLFNGFRSSVFAFLIKKGGFENSLKITGHSVRDFISNFIVFRMNPIFPFPGLFLSGLFLSEGMELICIKTACEMNAMVLLMRSSYPEVFSLLAQNEIAFQNIILVWKTQMCIKEKRYFRNRSRKLCYPIYSVDITDHPINDLFVFCMLAITYPQFIEEKIFFFIKNFGYRTELLEDPYDSKYLEFLRKNCKTSEAKFLRPCDDIRRVIGAFSRMPNSDGAHGVKYTLQPGTVTSRLYRIDESKFECLTMEVERQYPILRVFTKFLEVFLHNFAKTLEEFGERVLLPNAGGSALLP
jgi:hypothetical protein